MLRSVFIPVWRGEGCLTSGPLACLFRALLIIKKLRAESLIHSLLLGHSQERNPEKESKIKDVYYNYNLDLEC